VPTLGSIFGDTDRRLFVERQLVPGVVIYLEISFPQVTKSKYLVLVGEAQPDCFTFIINSETNRFIESSPDLNACQVSIDAESHTFLRHNSTIACHEVLYLSKEAVVAELISDTARIKGEISHTVRQEILAAVKFARTIDLYTQQIIINALS